jgi:Skp family chaperone for outer membrane proteins
LVRAAVAALALAGPGLAQDASSPILTLDEDRFFVESAFGKAAVERERTATAALEQENKRIEAELVAEELALTELRKTLPPEEFATRAEAFDTKVERIREEQDAKARVLIEAREGDRREFREVALPILAELLNEKGALVILDRVTVILPSPAIDITDEAIAKVNAALAGPDPAAP